MDARKCVGVRVPPPYSLHRASNDTPRPFQVDGSSDAEFWNLLGAPFGAYVAPAYVAPAYVAPAIQQRPSSTTASKVLEMELFLMKDDGLEFDKVADGPLKTDDLQDDGVMITKTAEKVFVSLGQSAPLKAKALAIMKAQALMSKLRMPQTTHIKQHTSHNTHLPCHGWSIHFGSQLACLLS